MNAKIHPTAVVESGAELGVDVEVGPFTHIRAGARIGSGTKIHSHVCIWGESEIGEENEIFPYVVIGAPPQIIGDPSLKGRAIIGKKNVIREAVEIHRGSSREDGTTRVGNESYIMSSVHIAHDCKIGNNVIIASKTGFAGHVKVEDFATVSGACGVSQFVRIGSYTYGAGMSRYEKDLPPFMCTKEFAAVTGPNLVGMKRAGFSEEDMRIVKEVYKALYLNKNSILKEQMEKLALLYSGKAVFDKIEDFIKNSKVGIMRRG